VDQGIRTFTVTFELRAVSGDTMNQRTFVNTVVAVDQATAHILGERIGRTTERSLAYTGTPWTFDQATLVVAELDKDNLPTTVGPLLAAIEQEMLQGQEVQRVLAAAITRYGPIELDVADIDAAIPGAVTMANNGDTVWWILPHQFGVPFAVRGLPPLPDNGVVDGKDLSLHVGREVLVSTEHHDPAVLVPASKWQWRTVLAVQDHSAGPSWKTLLTEYGAQTIVTAAAYSVRNPRPTPVAVHLAGEGRDG
jgi:hypothetical protein